MMNTQTKIWIFIGLLSIAGLFYYYNSKKQNQNEKKKNIKEAFYPSLVNDMANTKNGNKLPHASDLVKLIKSKTPTKEVKHIYSSGQMITNDEGFVITGLRITYRQGHTDEWKSIGGIKLCRQMNDGMGTCLDLFPGGTYRLPLDLGISEIAPLILPFTPATIIVSYPPDFSSFLESDFLVEVTWLVPQDERSVRGLYDVLYSDFPRQFDMVVPDTNKHYAVGTYLSTHDEYNITGRERRHQIPPNN